MEPVLREYLRLSDRRDRNPSSVAARCNLLVRDRRRPMRLDMRPQLGRPVREEGRHCSDVVIKRLHVHD